MGEFTAPQWRKAGMVVAGVSLILSATEACGADDNDLIRNGKYELSRKQAASVNRIARTGFSGLIAYQRNILYGNGSQAEMGRQAQPLGSTIEVGGRAEDVAFTFEQSEGSSQIIFKRSSEDTDGSKSTVMVLTNPNPEFFGADNLVTPDEVTAFYDNRATSLETYIAGSDVTAKSDCNATLTMSDRSLAYRSDRQDGCPTNDQSWTEIVNTGLK